MGRISVGVGGVVLAAVVALAGASLALPPALRPGFVGQIKTIIGGVWLTHAGGRRLPAGGSQQLFVGDTIEVARSSRADLLVAEDDGGPVSVTPANSPFHIKGKSNWISLQVLGLYLNEWGWVLQLSQGVPISMQPSQGLTTTPTQFTPSGAQVVRAGAQVLPIVWLGPSVPARLTDATGNLACPEAAPATDAQPAFAQIDCPALAPGNYHLAVGSARASVNFDVVAENEPEPTGNPDEQAIAAAHTLKTRPNLRLQALADLQRLSPRSYMAAAIINRAHISP
jgi:hypothetical protein